MLAAQGRNASLSPRPRLSCSHANSKLLRAARRQAEKSTTLPSCMTQPLPRSPCNRLTHTPDKSSDEACCSNANSELGSPRRLDDICAVLDILRCAVDQCLELALGAIQTSRSSPKGILWRVGRCMSIGATAQKQIAHACLIRRCSVSFGPLRPSGRRHSEAFRSRYSRTSRTISACLPKKPLRLRSRLRSSAIARGAPGMHSASTLAAQWPLACAALAGLYCLYKLIRLTRWAP